MPCFLVYACASDPLPLPIEEEPVFKAVGTIDGEVLNIAAGIDDYIMDTYFEKDELEVYSFSGKFTPVNCSDCTEALTIHLRDRKVTYERDNFIRDFSIKTGEMAIAEISSAFQLNPSIYQFFPNNIILNDQLEYRWVFNNIDTVYTIAPIYQFVNASPPLVELSISDPGLNCSDLWQDQIDLWDLEAPCPVTTFSYVNYPNGMVEFLLPFFDPDIIGSSWDFGDDTEGTYGAQAFIPHQYDTPGTYEVCVDLTIIGNCTDRFCSQIQSHSGIGCAAGFDYQLFFAPENIQFLFSTVIIEWVSPDNKTYSSTFLDVQQPADSFFEILAVEPFGNDLDGEKTVKITADAKLKLFNTTDSADAITIEFSDLVFAVAHPDK